MFFQLIPLHARCTATLWEHKEACLQRRNDGDGFCAHPQNGLFLFLFRIYEFFTNLSSCMLYSRVVMTQESVYAGDEFRALKTVRFFY
jgi:hypothetical protein